MTSQQTQHQKKNPYNPKAASYNIQLGLAYLNQNNAQRAKGKLLLALKQNPQSSVTYDAYAYFLAKTGNLIQAEDYYKKALRVEPGNGKASNNYGTFLCQQNRFLEADKYFMAATKDVNYLNLAEAYENAGICAEKAKDFDKAIHYFHTAIKQDGQRKTALYELAKLEYQKQEYLDAARDLINYHSLAKVNSNTRVLAQKILKHLEKRKQVAAYVKVLKTQIAKK